MREYAGGMCAGVGVEVYRGMRVVCEYAGGMHAGVLGVYSRHAGGMSAVAGHHLAACHSIRHGSHSCRRTYAGRMRVYGAGMRAGMGLMRVVCTQVWDVEYTAGILALRHVPSGMHA